MDNVHPTIKDALAPWIPFIERPAADRMVVVADIDNALQNIERLHMQAGEAIRELRDQINREIMPVIPRRMR